MSYIRLNFTLSTYIRTTEQIQITCNIPFGSEITNYWENWCNIKLNMQRKQSEENTGNYNLMLNRSNVSMIYFKLNPYHHPSSQIQMTIGPGKVVLKH